MSKILKILLILTIVLSFALTFYYVQATSEDNISENTQSENSEEDENLAENENTDVVKENITSQSSLKTLSPSSGTSVSTKDNYSQANLELNNILCIILISLGVLLILFAIAILIRLKR